ncbi:MAG: NADH-quinone oxidoreductase subunit M [Actinobacteria bacterium]|nr:NADH-quinone oxidoreductase subunit M [Actinomycetota bacterium]
MIAALPVVHASTTQPFPFLTTLVILPAASAVVIALLPKSWRRAAELAGIIASLAVLALAITAGVRFAPGVSGYQMISSHQWVPSLGVSWSLGIDGISLFLVLLTALIFPLALLGGRSRRDPKAFAAWMMLLEAACLGSFVSLDLILFFLFFELTLVPAYFLIGGWGHADRGYAAVKFFVYTFLGSAFLLVGILALAFIHQGQTGHLSFNVTQLASTRLSGTAGMLLFWAFTAAFAVKAPIFPLHTWSPDAYAEAPVAGSVVLAAVMAKLGTYGIIRFDLTLFPRATVSMTPVLLTLAVIGILYGAVVASRQDDLKRLVSYSSLSHIGFIVLGLFALDTEGVTGGVLQMINHGLITAALFLLVGMIYRRRHTWQIPRLRGLQRPAPVFAAVFTVVMLAAVGLPGLNGFVGEFLILLGTFKTHRWWAVVATGGVVLSVVYFLWAYQRIFHGRVGKEAEDLPQSYWQDGELVRTDELAESKVLVGVSAELGGAGKHGGAGVPGGTGGSTPGSKEPGDSQRTSERDRFAEMRWPEGLILAPLVALIVLLGVYPQPVLERITPSVDKLLARVHAANNPRSPEASQRYSAGTRGAYLPNRQHRIGVTAFAEGQASAGGADLSANPSIGGGLR